MNRLIALILSISLKPWIAGAFQTRQLPPSFGALHRQASLPQKSAPLYSSDKATEEKDKSSDEDSTWSTWNDAAAKKYFQSDENNNGAPDATTWVNEPPDYTQSGDPNKKAPPKKKDDTVNSLASTSNSVEENTPKEDEEGEDEAPENKVRPPLSTIFNMQEGGSLVKQSNPWDIIFESDLSPFNLLDGKLGERGEVWTAASLLLLLCVASGGIPIPFLNSVLTFLGGPGLMLAGGALIFKAVQDLGSKNLTPFLTPTTYGSLKTDGVYKTIRHPIYSGLIALCGGFSVLTEDSNRLVLTAVLYFLLGLKADKEEEELLKKFPQYADYRDRTGKFFPGDWSFRS